MSFLMGGLPLLPSLHAMGSLFVLRQESQEAAHDVKFWG